MTSTELQRIKARVTATICETWRGDHDGSGNMVNVIEGRISADDFVRIFAELETKLCSCTFSTDNEVMHFCAAHMDAVNDAVADERDLCAKIADRYTTGIDRAAMAVATCIADEIRARCAAS